MSTSTTLLLLLHCLFTLPWWVIGTSRPTARPTTSLRPTAIGTKFITTGVNAKYVVPGSIFSVHAKTQAISIKCFDISMAGPPSPNPAPVEIYVLRYLDPGDRSAKSDYQLILQRNITGAGYSQATSLPDLSTPVVIPSGATYSFYITIANMTLGTNLGVGTLGAGVFASDDYLDVSDGYSLSYPFGLYTADKRWCGACSPPMTASNRNTSSNSLQTSCFHSSFLRQYLLLNNDSVSDRQAQSYAKSKAKYEKPNVTAITQAYSSDSQAHSANAQAHSNRYRST